MRGGRRGGLWSEEEIASSGTGSERTQGRERSRGDPPASQGPRDPALAAGHTPAAPGTGDRSQDLEGLVECPERPRVEQDESDQPGRQLLPPQERRDGR